MQHLNDAQRQQLRTHVARERERTAARLAALAREHDNIVTASADAVRDDEHDPEGSTIAFERAQVASLLADAHGKLAALDRVSDRIDGSDLGRCDRCGGAIGWQRLLARPTTTVCVSCAAPRPGRPGRPGTRTTRGELR
ncbi:MAG: TraR/DksA family transcriptional regulator [Egibacteraceae bacterium]